MPRALSSGGCAQAACGLSRVARRRAPPPGRGLCAVLPAPQPEVQANDDGGDDQNRGEHRRADPYRGAPLSCSDIMGDLVFLRPGMSAVRAPPPQPPRLFGIPRAHTRTRTAPVDWLSPAGTLIAP